MIVVLDIQHAGQPSNPRTLGAGADLDGDGVTEAHEMEARLTPLYAETAARVLREHGVQVVIETAGEYRERQARTVALARADPTARVAYVACHLNAGGGDYGLAVHDHRSRGGVALARAIADALEGLSQLRRRVVGTTAPDSFPRAHRCVEGIYAGPANVVGVCFEPCFMDRPEHRPLLTPAGLDFIGYALADGLLNWLEVSP